MGEAVASAAEASPPDPDIAEAAASALRAVVDKLADLDPSKVSGFCFEEGRGEEDILERYRLWKFQLRLVCSYKLQLYIIKTWHFNGL